MPYWHDLRTIRHGPDLAGGLPRHRRGPRFFARGRTPPRDPARAQPPDRLTGKMARHAAVRAEFAHADADTGRRNVPPYGRGRAAPNPRRTAGGAGDRAAEGRDHLCRGDACAVTDFLSRMDPPRGDQRSGRSHSTGGGQFRSVRKTPARCAGAIPARALSSIDHEPAGFRSLSKDRSRYGRAGSDQRAAPRSAAAAANRPRHATHCPEPATRRCPIWPITQAPASDGS